MVSGFSVEAGTGSTFPTCETTQLERLLKLERLLNVRGWLDGGLSQWTKIEDQRPQVQRPPFTIYHLPFTILLSVNASWTDPCSRCGVVNRPALPAGT